MINSKIEYRQYLTADATSMDINPASKKMLLAAYFKNPRWRFIRLLRKTEYYKNVKKGLLNKLYFSYTWFRYKKLELKLGFTIPINVCGKGLSLPHYGTIVISKEAKIGDNCRIHVCVNIGASNGGAPCIGDNVYIGPGAKLFGKINIGSNNSIGANSVVNKSFNDSNVVIAGIPAKILKATQSNWRQSKTNIKNG